ncbi:SprT-like family-domain-containing protein [Apiosordaria backusii]|uniref:SprT-like family-domain-containing protein n=1 Tax=Apiosordaria backusii TaxID=314023 RepID=A0AA40ASX4_9PEZI|nr:SprT-like family-domain-containing protein [Apiosordaria backusii]
MARLAGTTAASKRRVMHWSDDEDDSGSDDTYEKDNSSDQDDSDDDDEDELPPVSALATKKKPEVAVAKKSEKTAPTAPPPPGTVRRRKLAPVGSVSSSLLRAWTPEDSVDRELKPTKKSQPKKKEPVVEDENEHENEVEEEKPRRTRVELRTRTSKVPTLRSSLSVGTEEEQEYVSAREEVSIIEDVSMFDETFHSCESEEQDQDEEDEDSYTERGSDAESDDDDDFDLGLAPRKAPATEPKGRQNLPRRDLVRGSGSATHNGSSSTGKKTKARNLADKFSRLRLEDNRLPPPRSSSPTTTNIFEEPSATPPSTPPKEPPRQKGLLSSLSAPTGGVKILWSKTLATTAGRANWKRETIRPPSGLTLPNPQPAAVRHHCSIELSTKVISDPHRLYNVLAHEFCHLCNFMISGVTTNPHGKEFKAWGEKVTKEFGDSHGIEVTTKHTYEIDFKYVWRCMECEMEFKRHSKSIDTARHRCGGCKGVLTQIRPTPRGTGGGGKKDGEGVKGEEKKQSAYQVFMKDMMKKVKQEQPGIKQNEVMKVVAERWKLEKAKNGGSAAGTLKTTELSVRGKKEVEVVDLT